MINLRSFSLRPQPRELAASPYSTDIVELLSSRFALRPGQFGVDVGCGPGRLAALFLERGFPLVGVEDDPQLRIAAQRLTQRFPAFHVVSGNPAATGLPTASADFLISERALFAPDLPAVRNEFRRILRPGASVTLVTDKRVYSGGHQQEAYEHLLRTFCPGFREKRQTRDIPAAVALFFGTREVYEDAFVGYQRLNLTSFLAQSVALPIFPSTDSPLHKTARAAFMHYFQDWSRQGVLTVPVVCRVACARLGSESPARMPIRPFTQETRQPLAMPA